MTAISRCTPATATPSHLEPVAWARANRHVLAKALAEFSHERLIDPAGLDGHSYVLEAGCATYTFQAERLALDHWLVDPASIAYRCNGEPRPPDVQTFLLEFRHELGLRADVLPVYLEEIASTVAAQAFKLHHCQQDAGSLALADYQRVERGMTEGHPAFVANSGRVGFDAGEYPLYAPEGGAAFPVLWLAVAREHACYSHVDGLEHERLLAEELDAATLERFRARLADVGVVAGDYWFMPVHPWQWLNRLAAVFAADIATRRIVLLGESDDDYAPQQSIRTLFNRTHPERRYIKTALSILNMGFMRGLSPAYMQGTPAINQWLAAIVRNDAVLVACGFDILCEQAAIGYRQPGIDAALDKGSPYRKMLAALWRESAIKRLGAGERLMTMAALVHVDAEGRALLPALIEASGLSARDWLRRYLGAYLRPLVHCLYTHDLAFMPHGENLLLVLDGHIPVRVLMKDIAEEIVLINSDRPLPDDVARIRVRIPAEQKVLAILSDVFDGFFRFLSAVLYRHDPGLEAVFWQEVAACIAGYQAERPEQAAAFARDDLFAPGFARSCLNRLQLANNRQMIDLADPSQGLQFFGQLDNPIAGYRPEPQA
jgi:siderophore synthetase component